MPVDREITRPMLGTDQEPTALTWKTTLRSPSESVSGPRLSRSRSRSAGVLKDSLRGRTPSPLNKSIEYQPSKTELRKSHSGKLGTSFSKSAELKEIENDYIKNLQQQVYFLELESNYLREQAKKATDLHPVMTAEAERMLTKLRALQSEIDGLHLELRRKDASLELRTAEKSKVLQKLTEEEREKVRMKLELQDELDCVKQERDSVTLENVRLGNQVERLLSEKESVSMKLRESQNTLLLVQEQLNEKIEQQDITQRNLQEKRAQCIDAESRIEKIEEHYYNTTQHVHNRQLNELKNDLRISKQQNTELERQVHDERFLKNKTKDENEQLNKSNYMLRQQLIDLEEQMLKEQEVRKELEKSHTEDMIELTLLSDREKELQLNLRSTQQSVVNEKERCDRYLEQVKNEEEKYLDLEATNNRMKVDLAENQVQISTLEKENSNLRRDKEILTDHVADLQKQLTQKSSDLSTSQLHIRELETDLAAAETEKRFDESIQSEKWREFETLADGMKKLSRTMARTPSTTKSPRSSVKFS